MRVLIPTHPDDTHALSIKRAMEKTGHQVTLIFTIEKHGEPHILNAQERTSSHQTTEHYDVVWWRKPRCVSLSKNSDDRGSYNYAVRDNALFHQTVMHDIAPNAWWINAQDAANCANFKLLQLKIASECGMSIPTTLCSNDPNEIRLFMRKHQIDGVMFKPLFSNAIAGDLLLPMSQKLKRTPGILQVKAHKKHMVRVTCFGNYLVAVRLNTTPAGNARMLIEPYTLPDDLTIKIHAFMHTTGVVFGTFDFVVTPKGEYVLLDMNEQGQFLWIEECNPALKMADIFINFLLAKSIDYHWEPTKNTYSC